MARLLQKITPLAPIIFGLTLILTIFTTVPAQADIASLEQAIAEKVLGSEDAPLTIIEYASLGCSHCASFHHETFPKIKENFIDTGKVKFIYRDFPLGTPALAATMISRCADGNKFFGMVDLFFNSQGKWGRSEKPIVELTKIARFAGMSEADVTACFENQALLDHIQSTAEDAKQKHNINATPSFVINGETISGALPYEEFEKLINEALN